MGFDFGDLRAPAEKKAISLRLMWKLKSFQRDIL
jgi:hypothetical protein